MLPKWFPNARDHADGNFIEKHIECISREVNCRVIFVKGMKYAPADKIQRFKKHNSLEYEYRYFELKSGPFSFLFNIFLYLKLQFKAFSEIKQEYGMPSLCHAHVAGRSCLLPYYLKLRYNIPLIISEHWSGYYKDSGKMTVTRKIMAKFFLKRANAVTAVSKSLADAIKRNVGEINIDVVANVVDKVFLSGRLIQETEKPNIIHISNFIKEIKRTDQIIEVSEELMKEGLKFNLILIGDGSERKHLEENVSRSELLGQNVKFTGDIDQSDIAEYFKHATACVSFSKFETQSIVLLESISMGIPIIAPRVGGIPEHCEDKGILFNADSREEFKDAIRLIITEGYAGDRSKWRDYCLENFSCEKIALKFVDLYLKLKPELNVQ